MTGIDSSFFRLAWWFPLLLSIFGVSLQLLGGEGKEILAVAWDTSLKKGDKKRIFFPARTPFTITILRALSDTESYTVRSEQFKHLNQSKKTVADQPVVFQLQYGICEKPDILTLVKKGKSDQGGGEETLATLDVYPVTVKLEDEPGRFDVCFISLDKDRTWGMRYKVLPWHPDLKGRVRLVVMPPVYGMPKISLPKAVIDEPEGMQEPIVLPGSAPGVTGIVPMMARNQSAAQWDECGWRLKIQACSNSMHIPKRKTEPDKKLEAFLDKIWPSLSKSEDKSQKEGLVKFKELLRKYPDIPYLQETLAFWRTHERNSTMVAFSQELEFSDDDILFVASFTVDQAPPPVVEDENKDKP